jgi:hypothetical protein
MQSLLGFFYARMLFCNVTLTPLFCVILLVSKDKVDINKIFHVFFLQNSFGLS